MNDIDVKPIHDFHNKSNV